MTLEEQLEDLIKQREHSSWLGPVASDELGACLAAVDTLKRLQATGVPSALAVRLEACVHARAGLCRTARPGECVSALPAVAQETSAH